MHSVYGAHVLFIVVLTLECLAFLSRSYAHHQLSYKDITSLGASCSPNDTCHGAGRMTNEILISRKCNCDVLCAKYDTCCIDSPHILPLTNERSNISDPAARGESCLNIVKYPISIFGINKCKRNWRGNSEIKSLCETENFTNLTSPVALLPVTNPITATTYKNYFCALCNHVRDPDLVYWNIVIESREEINKSALLEQLVYDTNRGKWGIQKVGLFEKSFETVYLSFYPSEALYDKLYRCVPDLVSTCHPDWKDDAIKQKCSAYTGIISADVKINSDDDYPIAMNFKNVHCAICNFAQYEPVTLCEENFLSDRRTVDISFSVLFDINTSDGKRVGEINRCQEGELYDHFFKKCRAMICTKRGYRVVNGKCVRR